MQRGRAESALAQHDSRTALTVALALPATSLVVRETLSRVQIRPSPRLRIAMLAPPWIEVPPPGYGGIEAVVDALCAELVSRGHAVTLFAPPGSSSAAEVRPLLDAPRPRDIGQSMVESDHVARAFAEIDAASAAGIRFDVVHDHCGFAALAMADRLDTPLVHTVHGPFTPEVRAFYAEHAHKALITTLSAAQRSTGPAEIGAARVVPNPIALAHVEFSRDKSDYVLWVGRMTQVKGPHRAIDAARGAGTRIVLAGPVQPGQEQFFRNEVVPRLDGTNALYVGEIGAKAKNRLFVSATALLMPIRWPEPFGMVMIEALAAGTPVIAYPEGAAAEIVIDGQNGLLVQDEVEMAAAIRVVGEIDPAACRRSVVDRYDVGLVARQYEAVYRVAGLASRGPALATAAG